VVGLRGTSRGPLQSIGNIRCQPELFGRSDSSDALSVLQKLVMLVIEATA